MHGPNSRQATAPAQRATSGAPRLRLLALGLALAGGGSARAQNDPNPYYIGINQALTHNTNINNVAGGPGDSYSSTGLVGGVDQTIGRQHVYGSANVFLNRYREFTQLNNTSYGLNAGWDWQTVGRLSGTVNTSVSQGLANLQNNLLQNAPDDNLVRTQQLGTRANWGGGAAVSVQGGYGYSKTSYSSPTLQASGSDNSSADIGVYYQPGTTLSLGTALRYTRSNADGAVLLGDGTLVGNRTSGRNIDLSANWRATSQSGATARLSYTRQNNSAGGGGYSGLTGALGFNYTPTGKLSFNGQYSRDAATNGSFYNTFTGTTTQSSVGLAANNSISNSVSLGANYSVTAKVNVTANLQYGRTTQEGTADSGYRDALTSFNLGASWTIYRQWSVACNASRLQRRLSGSFASDYDGNIYSCSTQILLR